MTDKKDTKTTIIKFRVTKKDKEKIQERVANNNMDLSTYVRKLIELDSKEGIICRPY